MLLDTDSHRRLMLTPVTLICKPSLKLFYSSKVVSSNRIRRSLLRKTKHRSLIGLHHTRLSREALSNHELSERIFIISPYCADVVITMAGMNTTSRVNQLRYSTTRLDAG